MRERERERERDGKNVQKIVFKERATKEKRDENERTKSQGKFAFGLISTIKSF